MSHVTRLPLAAAALAFLASGIGAYAQDGACVVDTVPREMLAEHMKAASLSHGGFNLVATTNWTRFQSGLFLGLARTAMATHPEGGVLFIPAESMLREFVTVAELTDAAAAPAQLRWMRSLGGGTQLSYGPPHAVIDRVVKGPAPGFALNVRIGWPDGEDRPDHYSILDTLSVPKLRVTNRRLVTLRMLDFGDMVVYDDVEGTSGRPLSGVLGALFKVLGDGHVEYSRSAFSEDGVQVLRARATKIFSRTATVTIWPDGDAEKDVPKDRDDLAALAERLEQDLEIEYQPYRCW